MAAAEVCGDCGDVKQVDVLCVRTCSTHTVHIVCGRPGCGKSTYGAKLAHMCGAALLDIDTCTERLVMAGLSSAGHDSTDRDSPGFKETYRQAIYETLFDIAVENLKHIDVVIVGPFTKEIRDVTWPAHLTKRLDTSTSKVQVQIHYVFCGEDVRYQRLIDRGNPRDVSKLSNWAAHSSYYDGEHPPVFEHIVVNTS